MKKVKTKFYHPQTIDEAINDLQTFFEADMYSLFRPEMIVCGKKMYRTDVLKNEKEFLIYLAGHFDILRKEIRRIRRKNKDKLKIITTKDKWGRVRTQIKWQ